VAALTEQIGRLIHTSNIYRVREQESLAERLCELSGLQEVFFGNSGSEANEGALKLVRLYGHKHGEPAAQTIVMERAWHGRTLATLAATGSEKARKGFDPLPSGFLRVPYNDLGAVERCAAADPRVRAVWLEVLQGEGGIQVADLEYVRGLRRMCDERGWLLMIDEVQSGIGRTGHWFAHQWAGIRPDVITLAKGLGSGVPIGALLAGGRAAGVFGPGQHGTTFGGGPLAMRAGLETLAIIEAEGLMANAVTQGERLRAGLQRELAGVAGVREVRGMGLMCGVELDRPCAELVKQALAAGLLINVTQDTVVRLLPPLIVSAAEIDQIVARLAPLISDFISPTARAA
jgi:acetylornithine/N-succinyldiaminopimelate aminotransferase